VSLCRSGYRLGALLPTGRRALDGWVAATVPEAVPKAGAEDAVVEPVRRCVCGLVITRGAVPFEAPAIAIPRLRAGW
jgi:hypothetical protein